MVRLTLSAIILLCGTFLSVSAMAADFASRSASRAAVDSPSANAARLYALGITTRAQGNVNQESGATQSGFIPPMPSAAVAPPAAAPVVCGSGGPGPSGSNAGMTSLVNGGMRFMPLHRDTPMRTFAMPQRREVIASAQALRVAVAGSKNESDLAQAALQAANAPSPQTQAQAELASLAGNAGGPAPAANATALANEQVLAQIQRYRNTHNAW
jgi:hypothetical protein